MSETKEFKPYECADERRLPLMWGTNLQSGSLGIYDSTSNLIIVRSGMGEASIRFAVAQAVAAYDIARYGPDPEHGADSRALAVARLLPDQQFTDAYQTLGGGVTALAGLFDVPTNAIVSKMDALRVFPPSRRFDSSA